jgi:hypothetical protein
VSSFQGRTVENWFNTPVENAVEDDVLSFFVGFFLNYSNHAVPN